MFKEFGVRLNFKPTIAGDVIRLKVRPEVSSLDFNNGITLSGFRIPALTTRRAETDVELRDGQSFAIAGLLDNISQNDRRRFPLLSKLPIIGTAVQEQVGPRGATELMVLITPRLVRAAGSGRGAAAADDAASRSCRAERESRKRETGAAADAAPARNGGGRVSWTRRGRGTGSGKLAGKR